MNGERVSALPPELVLETDARGFLRATVPDAVSLQWLLAAVDRVEAVTRQVPHSRVLLDLSQVLQAPGGLVEQTIVGEHIARHLAHCDKVASFVAQGTRSGITEQVAQRLNLALRVFVDEGPAIAWLTS
jgi:hypothetical protein